MDKSAPNVRYFGPGVRGVGDLELSAAAKPCLWTAVRCCLTPCAPSTKNVRIGGLRRSTAAEVREHSVIAADGSGARDLRDEAYVAALL